MINGTRKPWREKSIIPETMEEATTDNLETEWRMSCFRRCLQPVVLTIQTLNLQPQVVLVPLHCLKSTLSVLTVSFILTNCTVVVAVHQHAVLKCKWDF